MRYVRTRGIVEVAESRKTIGFRFTLCRTHSPRTARATNSCTPPVVWKEDGASPPCWLLVLLVTQKYDKEKFLYVSSLSEFFSLVRKERKGQKEESIPLLISFCRLAATGVNTLPRPSNHSLAAATGSKRSSADSDSLLCHVRLWRTSRLKFGCASGCEHSEIGFILIVPSAHGLHPRPPPLFSAGVQVMRARICSAFSCAMFARVV